jgi:putative redox protein
MTTDPTGHHAVSSEGVLTVIHAEDCADCETRSGWIDHIDRDIELVGDLDDAQRQRLLLIAERCPVHQTLTSEVAVATSLL